METRIYLFRHGRVLKKDSNFKPLLTGSNPYSLDSFLAFLAAFFSFGFKAGFFLSSLLLRCSLLMVVFQMFVWELNAGSLGIQNVRNHR